ncbi:MAG TPA: TlpA disulfide reductase family protein [Acidimicrobiia bacterium]
MSSRRRPARSTARRRAPAPRTSSPSLFWVLLTALVVAGVVAIVVVVVTGDDDGGSGADAVQVDGRALPDFEDPVDDPAVGDPAPGLEGVGFDGEPVATPEAGTPFVAVFLAHWCPHCQAEVPRIVSLADAGGTEGVDVLGIATGTNPDAPNYPPEDWLERERWPFPVLEDTADGRAASAYGLTSYPLLVFVDAEGRVAARVSGEIPEEDLATMFAALAAGEPVPVPGAGPASPG